MAIFVKIFAFVFLFCVITAMPVDEQQQEVAQVDLLAVESVPQTEVETAIKDDLTRAKRQCEYSKLIRSWNKFYRVDTKQNVLRK